MAIQVECSSCGAEVSVKESAAGKKLKCRCGKLIAVPKFDSVDAFEDDEDDLFDSRSSRSRGRRSGGVDPDMANLVKFAVMGGVALVFLLVGFFVMRGMFVKQPVQFAGPNGQVPNATFQPAPPRPPPPAPFATNDASQAANRQPARNNNTNNNANAGNNNQKSASGFRPVNGADDARPQQAAKNAKTAGGKANWGDGASAVTVVGTSGQHATVVLPTLSQKVVLVDTEVFDVESGESLGKFPGKVGGNNTRLALSDDGTILASASSNSVQSADIISVHAIGGKGFAKPLSTNGRGQQNNRVMFLGFAADRRLVAAVEANGSVRGPRIFVFNMETGKVVKDFACGDLGDVTVLSPDGKYLCNHSRQAILVYDLAKGVKVAAMECPKGLGQGIFAFGDCNGLEFSPDSSELAALTNGNRIVVWSAKGKVIFDEVLPRNSAQRFDRAADGLQWLPDGNSWLLGNQHLFQRDAKLLVWEMKRTWYLDKQPVRVLDQNHVLASVGNSSTGEVVKQEIPWEEIRSQTDAANLDAVALVKPGEAMSIQVEVFNVRFGNAQEVANILGTTLTKKIEQSKFKVKPDQKVILKAAYDEAQGEQKRVVEGFGFTRRDTGQRVNDSKGKLNIKIITKETGEVAWEQIIESGGGSSIEGEISDATVRNQMFKYIEHRVNDLALPTIIPKAGALQLPLVTNLEK